jgi:hypothetical protein
VAFSDPSVFFPVGRKDLFIPYFDLANVPVVNNSNTEITITRGKVWIERCCCYFFFFLRV